MGQKISVVINTLNEESMIERVIKSVSWADEILVCDMYSDDNTAVIARELGAKVIKHKRLSFVEPARNFAIQKAEHDWVLVLDPDEEVPSTLGAKLREIAHENSVTTHVDIPRKNMIFGKWVKASMWWPDYNIRFFKKEAVDWPDKIHQRPTTTGQGVQLPADERYAIIHHHYISISQFIQKLDRYSGIQAKELFEKGEKFSVADLIQKPLNEFLSRFFANRGYEDGLHGLILSLLQGVSFLVVYIKLWEHEGFEQRKVELKELKLQTEKSGKDLHYWFQFVMLSSHPVKRLLQKARNKIG